MRRRGIRRTTVLASDNEYETMCTYDISTGVYGAVTNQVGRDETRRRALIIFK